MLSINNRNNSECVFGISVIVSIIVGIIGTLLQITEVIDVTDLNIITLLAIAVFYLGLTFLSSVLAKFPSCCYGRSVSALLWGIFGTIVTAAILLIGATAFPAPLYAAFIGLLFFFVTLKFISMARIIVCSTYPGE